MIQKLYDCWESVWFWGPRHAWRPGNVLSCGRNRITIRYSTGEETSKIYHLSPCRVRPRHPNAPSDHLIMPSPFEFE